MTTPATLPERTQRSAFGRVLTRFATPIDHGEDPLIGLDHPDHAVLVELGALDVFAVAPTVDGVPGRWTFLFRATAGAVIPPGWSGSENRGIVAKATPRAYVSRVPIAALAALSAPTVAPGDPVATQIGAFTVTEYAVAVTQVTQGLEQTLVGLAGAVREELPPQDFVPLEARSTQTVPAGTPVRSIDGVQWVELATGTAHIGEGAASQRLEPGRLHCLTERDWLVAGSEVTISSRSSQDLLAEGELWSAVGVHVLDHGAALDHRVTRRRDEDRTDLEGYAAADARALDEASRGLRGVLAGDHCVLGPGDTAGERPVRAAVRLTAGRLGVVLHRGGADPRRVGRRMDPVRAGTLTAGLRCRPVALDGRWWSTDAGPMVARRLRDDAPVALLPSPSGYLAAWPGASRLTRVTAADAALLGPRALAPYRPLPTEAPGWAGLLRFGLHGARRDVGVLALTAVLAGLGGLAVPLATGLVLGILVPTAQRGLIVQVGLAVVGVALGLALVTSVQQLALSRLGARFDVLVQAAVWDRILALPTRFFARRSAGEVGAAVLGVRRLRAQLVAVLAPATLGWLAGLADLVLVLVLRPVAGVVLAVVVALGLGTGLVLARLVVRRATAAREAATGLSSVVLSMIEGLTTIRVGAAENRAFGRWAGAYALERRRDLAARRARRRVAVLAAVLPAVGLFGVLAMLAVDPGSPVIALIVLVAAGVVTATTAALAASLATGAALVPELGSLAPVLEARPEDARDGADPGDLQGAITLTHVSFGYDDGPLVLDDVSTHVEPGEFVAIVGPTGCGKSTLLRLLLGFGSPATGSILFDGQDLAELDAGAVRRQLGVVLQTGTLLAGTLLTNITCGGSYTREEAWEAAEMAGIAEDVVRMPMGMETVVSEDSTTLSGGQRQRLMIARALISKPRVVLLDEATSALDNPVQRTVAENTRRLNATRIVIAHRLSTIADADRILVLDEGRLVEEGTFAELLDADGLFARLARRQMLENADAPVVETGSSAH